MLLDNQDRGQMYIAVVPLLRGRPPTFEPILSCRKSCTLARTAFLTRRDKSKCICSCCYKGLGPIPWCAGAIWCPRQEKEGRTNPQCSKKSFRLTAPGGSSRAASAGLSKASEANCVVLVQSHVWLKGMFSSMVCAAVKCAF